MRRLFYLTACLVLISVGSPAGAVTIDTTPEWTGGGYIFGAPPVPGGHNFAQVFTVPLNANILESFAFFVSGSTPPVLFRGEIARWNSSTFETGPLLYSSDIASNANYPFYNGTVSNYGMPTFTIPDGLALVPGAQYAAILDTRAGNSGIGAIGNNFDVDAYSGGYHLFQTGVENGSTWYNANDTRDYAFLAVLTPVPEPASMTFLVTGLLGLIAIWRRGGLVNTPPPEGGRLLKQAMRHSAGLTLQGPLLAPLTTGMPDA
jgi:hypothetical protein